MAGFSTTGLAAEWDAAEDVRARVRDGGFLEDSSCGADPLIVLVYSILQC